MSTKAHRAERKAKLQALARADAANRCRYCRHAFVGVDSWSRARGYCSFDCWDADGEYQRQKDVARNR